MFIPCAIGYGQILIIVFVVLLLFGGRKIPELMRADWAAASRSSRMP